MYASLCDFVCIGLLLPFVLGFCLSVFWVFFSIAFSTCYHWWVFLSLVALFFPSFFYFFSFNYVLFFEFLIIYCYFYFNNFILFYFIYFFIYFFSLFF